MIRLQFVCLILILLPVSVFCISPECAGWFAKSQIRKGIPSCEAKCQSISVGLGTFDCPKHCAELCAISFGKPKTPVSSRMLGNVLYYPGLTEAENKLLKAHPKDAIVVFVQKTKAEFSADRNFPEGRLNDESDAFRHYVWAALLTKELGPEKAKLFLDAHEENPRQPSAERAMDLANNRGGILLGERLRKAGKSSLRDIEREALSELRGGNASVLKSGLTVPKEPK